MFEKIRILTPNDPKYPQMTPTPHLQNQKALLGHKLQFELSWAEIDPFRNEILRKQD